MERIRALIKFKRHYMHGIRDGLTPEKAATDALWKTRQELWKDFEKDPLLKNDIDREEAWSEVLLEISIYRMLIIDLPIDVLELERRRKEKDVEVAKLMEDSTPAATLLPTALAVGLDKVLEKEETDGTESK